ncbi:DUF221-domain-containing protein [Backusella circina FSU 941]|nr:DUF221-domain-containing protein [Backusella circina FSU 941]
MDGSDADLLFKKQQRVEDLVGLKAILVQIAINVAIYLAALVIFFWARVKYPLFYSSKNASKSKSNEKSLKWYDWIRLVLKSTDNTVLEKDGFDSYMFIYFLRTIRRLVLVVTGVAILVLLPLNIVATYYTGDWPPSPSLDFMSISAINYKYGKQAKSADFRWFWSPTMATWFVTLFIIWQMVSSSQRLLLHRKKYLNHWSDLATTDPTNTEAQENRLVSRTLLLQYIPANTSKEQIEAWAGNSVERWIMGKSHLKLPQLVEDYNKAIEHLEKYLNHYFFHQNDKRRLIKSPADANKVDAIDYYTQQVLQLDTGIKSKRKKLVTTNYGWVTFHSRGAAADALKKLSLQQQQQQQQQTLNRQHSPFKVQFAPHPNDVLWENLDTDQHTHQLKFFFGIGLFCSVTFIWAIPVGALAVLSNLINVIRLFPKSGQIIDQHQLLMGIIQSYLTPWLLILLLYPLPRIFQLVTVHQGCITKSETDGRVFMQLYGLFVINCLFIFSCVNVMIGIVGQITALTAATKFSNASLSIYVVQIAKNMTDISTFWINYICIESVSIVSKLVNIRPLFFSALFGMEKCYTPRQVEHLRSNPFPFAKNYSLIVAFFTVTLVYSIIQPIILPFSLIFFCLAMPLFKYKILYMYKTNVETYGKPWPYIFAATIISVIIFQIMMIVVLRLKAGIVQIYTIIPLPILTSFFLVYYTRRLIGIYHQQVCTEKPPLYTLPDIEMGQASTSSYPAVSETFFCPSYVYQPLWKPQIYDRFRPLLPELYKDNRHRDRILRVLFDMEREVVAKSEKIKIQEQEAIILLHPPDSNPYYSPINAGSSNQAQVLNREIEEQEYVIDSTLPLPSAPTLDIIIEQPPTYTDAIIAPRENTVRESPVQMQRRYSTP